jgi:4-amino-4-deoxy-L-arabinose transferase-like glycosyltransferase
MSRRDAMALVLLTLLGAALRFWRLGALALVGDEAYYWLWSRHLALSYYDHPAGVAVLVRLSTMLGGSSEAGIRWLNATLGVAAIPLAWQLTRQRVSTRAAWATAVLMAVSKPFVLISRHVYPDALLLALELLALLLVDRVLTSKGRPALGLALGVGVSVGMALATKYTAYLFAGVVLAFVLLAQPRLAREPRFWLATGVAALGLAPTLLWNAQRDWASFRWQAQHLGQGVLWNVGPLSRAGNLLDYTGWPVVLLAGCGALFWREPRARLLTLIGVALSLAVLLSPANAPRSLVVALPLLLGPGVEGLWRLLQHRGVARPALIGSAGALIALAAMAGGLSAATIHRHLEAGPWPWSGAAEQRMAFDAQGLRALRTSLLDNGDTIVALDYSLARQLSYYLGQPVATAWPQYAEWGLASLEPAWVVSAGYIDRDTVLRALKAVYRTVLPPRRIVVDGRGLDVWRVDKLTSTPQQALARLDLLRLVDEGGAP